MRNTGDGLPIPGLFPFHTETMDIPTGDHIHLHSTPLSRGAVGTRLTAALSLSIHALLLALLMRVTALPGPLDLPPHMGVDIVRAPQPQPAAAEKEEEKEKEKEEEKKPSPPDPPAPVAKPIAAPRPANAPKPVVTAPPIPQPVTTAPPGPDDGAAATVVAAPPSPPAGGSGAPDDSLRQYGQLVWSRIAAHKPRGMRLPGTATVTFAIGADGSLLSATVSNGSPLLNEVALETVRAAAPFPLPPPGARSEQLVFSIPFHFR